MCVSFTFTFEFASVFESVAVAAACDLDDYDGLRDDEAHVSVSQWGRLWPLPPLQSGPFEAL